MQIVRHSFRNGLIGTELQWQSDSENYISSLVQCQNMLPTPYGGISRRPPLVSIGSISSITVESVVYYPSDARAFDFIFSNEFRYVVVFVVYSSDGQDYTTRVVVQDPAGNQKAILAAPHTQLQILEMDYQQNNDTMWFTHQIAGQHSLVRLDDDDWQFDITEFSGGPFLDKNKDQNKELSTGVSEYQNDIYYQAGDIIVDESANVLTATWIGTVKSFLLNSTYNSELDTSAWKDSAWRYRSTLVSQSGTPISADHWFKIVYYPYLLIRISDTSVGVSVGDKVKLNINFTEDGGGTWDDDFQTSGTITDIYEPTGGTGAAPNDYYYIKIRNGAMYSIRYYRSGASHVYSHIGYANLPKPQIPASQKAYYESSRHDPDCPIQQPEKLFPISLYDAIRRRYHFFVFGVNFSGFNGGGAEIDGSNNVIEGDGAAYMSIQDGIGNALTDTDYFEPLAEIPQASPLCEIRSIKFSAFSENDVDRKISINAGTITSLAASFNNAGETTDSGQGSATDTPFYGLGTVQMVVDGGSWGGELVLEKSIDNGDTWDEVRSITATRDSNDGIVEEMIEDVGVRLRMRMKSWQEWGGESTIKCRLISNTLHGNIYKIVKYISDSSVIARIEAGPSEFTNTNDFAFGSWGGDYGFPGVVSIDGENRIWYRGSVGEPFKSWGSVVGKYNNFVEGVFDTSAISFEARVAQSTRITWDQYQDRTFFGTDFGEFSAANLDQTRVLSATNLPRVQNHTSEGSARIQAILVGASVAYISADKKKLKLLVYDGLEQDGYRSYDVTEKLPEAAGSGFVGMVLQRTPYPVLWLWTEDGNAVSVTVRRESGTLAFSTHSTTNGSIKSMCVLPDDNGIDEVYAVVERDQASIQVVDEDGDAPVGVTGIYTWSAAEYPSFSPSWAKGDYSVFFESVGVSFYLINNSTGEKWKSVTGNASGIYDPFSGGAVGSFEVVFLDFFIEKLDYSETEYTDNLNGPVEETITSIFEPTPISRGPNFLEGKMKFRCNRGFIYLYKSNGGEISVDGGSKWASIDYSKLTADSDGLYTGAVEFIVNSDHVDYSTVRVRTTDTYPFKCVGIRLDVKKHEIGGRR